MLGVCLVFFLVCAAKLMVRGLVFVARAASLAIGFKLLGLSRK